MLMRHARTQLVNWFAVAGKQRRDTEGLGNLLSNHIPIYRNLMTSCFARK